MIPDWLKEIETQIADCKDTYGYSYEDYSENIITNENTLRLLSALKLAIEGLEFYAKSEDYHRPIWGSDPGSGITLDSTVEKDRGTKAREILEKIKRGEG